MTPSELRTHLADVAAGLGFHAFGVAPAVPLAEHREFLAQWLVAGHAAQMSYMAEHEAQRGDPQLLLEGAKSVVCLLVDYRDGADPGPEPAPHAGGKVARYARGRDYHIVVKKRLRKLGQALEVAAPGARWKPCVDSVPLLERAYAWRAGLGFFGKNTLLLRPGTGSYTLLAELLVDVELPPDEPGEGTCGRCTRCLDACPTDAFPAPFQLDAARCISYWSIEHRGPLPEGADLHGWAFGCDICQEVCPYNHGPEAVPLGEDFDTPRAPGPVVPPAVGELPDKAAYLARYAGTPLMRAGLEGMRRNLAALAASKAAEEDA